MAVKAGMGAALRNEPDILAGWIGVDWRGQAEGTGRVDCEEVVMGRKF